jgi:hypothetical protein
VGDYSRLLTQHAIRMVQRNMTPGGDKNGADITMALDALEMCFTHDHINAFVIVGGDSDFISLVEKLKQYGRKVIVVGGRQFTSQTMQKNCHEFIAYENLVASQPSQRGGRPSDRGSKPATSSSDIAKAIPLIKRALKVLSEREVTPQLGLLKSTLLQLDSTFSEREYGANSFRDFMEKVAKTGAVTLKEAGRSMLVESRPSTLAQDASSFVEGRDEDSSDEEVQPEAPARPLPADVTLASANGDSDEEDAIPASPMTAQDGIRAVQQAFGQSATPVRWPMYVRQAKQFMRNAIEGFDERRYGFASVVDLLRAAGKEGVLRIERDRQGAVRIFPGPGLNPRPLEAVNAEPIVEIDETVDVVVPSGNIAEPVEAVAVETVADAPILDADTMEEPADGQLVVLAGKAVTNKVFGGPRARKAVSPRGGRGARPTGRSAHTADVEAPARKAAAPRAARLPAKPRARKSTR